MSYPHHEKRFDYNIASHFVEEELPQKYQTVGIYRREPQNLSNTSPINRRSDAPSSITATLEDRLRKVNRSQQRSMDQSYDYKREQMNDYEARGRINSASGFKKTQKGGIKNSFEEPYKHGRKVYFGGDENYCKQFEGVNISKQSGNKYNSKDINYSMNVEQKKLCDKKSYDYGEESIKKDGRLVGNRLQENINAMNIRDGDFKESQGKMKKQRNDEPTVLEVNEKEIVQKINRINRLNEEINNRLQRMLTKMDQ